jgi:hypothetical protein
MITYLTVCCSPCYLRWKMMAARRDSNRGWA